MLSIALYKNPFLTEKTVLLQIYQSHHLIPTDWTGRGKELSQGPDFLLRPSQASLREQPSSVLRTVAWYHMVV